MALADGRIRDTLITCSQLDKRINLNDESTIWRKIFISGMFRAGLDRTHYWILDAIDECRNRFFISMLSKTEAGAHIRIFFTSRKLTDIEKSLTKSDGSTVAVKVTTEDTLRDIARYLDINLDHLVQGDEEVRNSPKSRILGKSHGCFLWVVLVLNELDQTYGANDIQQVLQEIPAGINALYERILNQMADMTRGKQLVQAILT